MGFLSVLSFAHKLVAERLQPGGLAIDATAGTGADTLFLARTAGARGRVFAFDIQEEALQMTRQRLAGEAAGRLADVSLILGSHDKMRKHIPPACHGRIAAVMFNLGYLPSPTSDKGVITSPGSTVPALDAALELLAPGGIISVVVYPGHEGGSCEAEAVEAWASSLPRTAAQAVMYRGLQRHDAPYLIALERRKTV